MIASYEGTKQIFINKADNIIFYSVFQITTVLEINLNDKYFCKNRILRPEKIIQ